MIRLDSQGSVRWQHFLAPHTDIITNPGKSPGDLLGEVTQPSESWLSETNTAPLEVICHLMVALDCQHAKCRYCECDSSQGGRCNEGKYFH